MPRVKVFTLVKDLEQLTLRLPPKGNVTSYHRNGLRTDVKKRGNNIEWQMFNDARTAIHQQLVAFAWCSSVEIKIPSTCLTEQVLANDAAKLHRVHIPTEETHQLFTANPLHAAGHHRLNGGL